MKIDRELMKNVSLFVLLIAFLSAIVYLGLHFRKLGERLEYQLPVGSPAIPLEKAGPSHKVYVPAYSHVFTGSGDPNLLAVTLSIRNTDSSRSIIVTSVQYYDSKGALVREYLENPLELTALASTEFFVEELDRTGGAGANFIVDWSSNDQVHQPLIEAVMIGGLKSGRGNISLISRGIKLVQQSKPDVSR